MQDINSDRMRAFVEQIKSGLDLRQYRKNRPRPEVAETWSRLLDILIAELVNAALFVPPPPREDSVNIAGLYVNVKTSHRNKSRYEPDILTTKLVWTAVRALQSAGLVRVYEGCKTAPVYLDPTDAFTQWVKDAELTPVDIIETGGGELIQLSDKARGLIDYIDTPETLRMRAEVERINAFLEHADITVIDRPEYDTAARELYRTFLTLGAEERFDLLGRLFGGFWINMPRDDRWQIRINGEEIADLDFSAMHLRLAYLKAGLIPPDGELYSIPPYEASRDGIKFIVLAMLNAPGLKNWPEDSNELFPKGTYLPDVKATILAHHPAIKPILRSGLGIELSYTESRIMVDTLLRLIEAGVVALPIHDGLVCAQSQAETAKAIMQDSAERITGFRLPVVRKR